MIYDSGLARLEEPAAVKAALPIAYVMERAGMQLYAGDGTLHALCPFHDDHSPSLDIYRWGDGERWGCWVCGVGGDVFDLMQRLWGLRFRESVDTGRRAVEMMRSEGWTGGELRGRWDWDEQAAARLLSEARRSGVLFEDLVRLKGWRFPADWLAHRWDVAAAGSHLLVPYYDRDRSLVALKHRRLDGRGTLISLPGSRLRNVLYGEWRAPKPGVPVVLCEGESDTWTMDYLHGATFDVLGVPAGAGTAPWVSPALRDREVVIMFDGDEAGRTGARRWQDAVREVASGVEVRDLPDGEDLASLAAAAYLPTVD